MAARQQTCQQKLQMVGILILVDEHIAELILIVFPGVFVALQQSNRMQNNVVKVQSVGFPQPFIVKLIYFTYPYFPPIAPLFP